MSATTKPDLTTEEGMRQFLSATYFPHISSPLELLSGGSSKFIYRVPGALEESSSKSVIAIHAANYSAGIPDFSLPQARLKTEYTLCSALSSGKFPETRIRTDRVDLTTTVPTAYRYFAEEAVMIVEDVQDSITLKSALVDHEMSVEKAEAIGLSLGQFAAKLHHWGASDEEAAVQLRADLGENLEAKEISFTVFYHWLEKTANEVTTGSVATQETKDLIQKVKAFMREEMFSNREQWTVLHGDFWTGNVLVPRSYIPPPYISDPITSYIPRSPPSIAEARKLHVLDWELAKLAPPHFDLGQMLAELYLPLHFYGRVASPHAMISAFLASYARLALHEKSREEVLELAFKSMMHFGGHLIVWPRLTGWPDDGGKVAKVMEFGVECVKKGWERDVEFLEGGVFRGFLGGL